VRSGSDGYGSCQPASAGEAAIVPLGPDDIAEMLALVDAARPGPFEPRTTELGRYVGVRDAVKGCLVAMAGERFCPPLYVELRLLPSTPKPGGGASGRLSRRTSRAPRSHAG
jgi:hypothetical protein